MSKFMNARARESALFASPLERFLRLIGVTPAFSDSVLGDMDEEFAQRAAERGILVARLCYAWDAVVATPYFLANAVRYGSPEARVRLTLGVGALALLATIAMSSIISRNGPPVRLVASGAIANAVVVNNERPVQLEMRVLDQAGNQLKSRGVQFAWESGREIRVSSAGVVTCTRDGDALVRASLGDLTTLVEVRCRRVMELQASSWMDFVVGDSARDLPYVAYGVIGQQVTELRGLLRNADSSVATITGSKVHPRAAGQTAIDVALGDYAARILVLVHERVPSFDALRGNRQFVAVPVHVARGDTMNLALPQGSFWLKYLAQDADHTLPTMTLNGAVSCRAPVRANDTDVLVFSGAGTWTPAPQLRPGVEASYCTVHSAGASVTLSNPFEGAGAADGMLAIDRVRR